MEELLEILKNIDTFTYRLCKLKQDSKMNAIFTMSIDDVIKKRIFSIIINNIDVESSERLIRYEEIIKQTEKEVAKMGWSLCESGCIKMSSFKTDKANKQEWNTSVLTRTKGGFLVFTDKNLESTNKVRSIELEFLNNNKELLDTYHNVVSAKEDILHGDFNVKGPLNYDQIMLLIKSIGYEKKDYANHKTM